MDFNGITGFDISHWQGDVDFARMKGGGASFVIMKAGQGNWEDPKFAENWKAAKGILPRATYWFFDNRYPPKEQARKYFEIIKRDLEGMCWLDLEDGQAGMYAGWQSWYDFITELKAIYPGARVGIYSNFYYWLERTSFIKREQRDWFGQFPLWLASYQPDPFNPRYSSILVPLPWLDYLILQSGTPAIGRDAGVQSKEIDYNQFCGDEAKFIKVFGQATNTPQPETGEPMARYTVTIHRDGARLRPNHDTDNTAYGTIPGGIALPCDEVFTATAATTYQAVGDKWAKVSYAFNGLTYVGWVAIVHLGSPICAIQENATTPPATDEVFVSVEADITATVNGKQYHGAVMFENVQLRLVE